MLSAGTVGTAGLCHGMQLNDHQVKAFLLLPASQRAAAHLLITCLQLQTDKALLWLLGAVPSHASLHQGTVMLPWDELLHPTVAQTRGLRVSAPRDAHEHQPTLGYVLKGGISGFEGLHP